MSSIPSLDCYRKPLLLDNIRLLRLLPDEEKTAPIQCELIHYSLQESGRRTHQYEALSYVWGSLEKSQCISIREYDFNNGHDSTSGHDLPVTENLHAALTHLRYPLFERILWVDAVCINQDDEREKEQQIQFMAKIYALANRVVVWLGEAAEDSDQALCWIRMAGGQKSNISPSDQKIQQAVVALLQRPWFRRIWVLQEVAAARCVLIKCGPTEIDGLAFCLGIGSFEGFSKSRIGLQNLARSVAYLIRGAIFRPDFSMSKLGRSSLDICSLGELVDMYHAHEATNRHDKIFALLGMSSDDLSKANLLPDYRVPWEELLQRLIKYLLYEEISVKTWGGNGETIVIKSKGYVIGTVILVKDNTLQDDREGVDVVFKNPAGEACVTLQESANSVRRGDIVCLLQGASNLTIIRKRQKCFDVVMIAARPQESKLVHNLFLHREWPDFLRLGMRFPRDFVLIWGCGIRLGKVQGLETDDRVLGYSQESEGYLDKATRIWNVALILGDSGRYQESEETLQEAKEILQEAIKSYEIVFGIQNSYTLGSRYGLTPLSWAAENGYDAVVRLLLAKDGVDPDSRESQFGRTPLSLAAGGGKEAVVKLLLETGKVEVNSRDKRRRTPLSWAAEKGYKAIVKLLLETNTVEVDSEDVDRRTPLCYAVGKGHRVVVKLLLETGKTEVNSKDYFAQTLLQLVANTGAVVNLLRSSIK